MNYQTGPEKSLFELDLTKIFTDNNRDFRRILPV